VQVALKRNERAQINKCKLARDFKVREREREGVKQGLAVFGMLYAPPPHYICARIGVFGTPVDLSNNKSAL
jgi:hypothetical protein